MNEKNLPINYSQKYINACKSLYSDTLNLAALGWNRLREKGTDKFYSLRDSLVRNFGHEKIKEITNDVFLKYFVITSSLVIVILGLMFIFVILKKDEERLISAGKQYRAVKLLLYFSIIKNFILLTVSYISFSKFDFDLFNLKIFLISPNILFGLLLLEALIYLFILYSSNTLVKSIIEYEQLNYKIKRYNIIGTFVAVSLLSGISWYFSILTLFAKILLILGNLLIMKKILKKMSKVRDFFGYQNICKLKVPNQLEWSEVNIDHNPYVIPVI